MACTLFRVWFLSDSAEAEQDVRDLALAWQSLANGGWKRPRPRLRAVALGRREFPNDPESVTALAYVEQRHGSMLRHASCTGERWP